MTPTTVTAATIKSAGAIDVQQIRSQFPALSSDTVLLENAGGSQVPQVVADQMREYMLNTYVQLGAGYALSQRCTQVVEQAHEFINLFMNGVGSGKVILGPSCTQLCSMLANCYAETFKPGDEIIIAQTGHEANIGPWVNAAQRCDGVFVKWWQVEPENMKCSIASLYDLLSDRTRIVAFPHVSNLLGEIVDVRAVANMAHQVNARVVVDGVAYAPHRAIDVSAWDVDWYVYSTYKVYGPHMAAMYGKHDAIGDITGPNHFFIPREEVPYKFELGGACHEGCAGLLALGAYLNFLAGREAANVMRRQTIVDAFELMMALELPLQERLVEYLLSKPKVRIVGPAHAEASRVATISFVHESISSHQIAATVNASNIGIRHGHMYAHRLCEALAIEPNDGVVRTSCVHYNTMDEVDRLIEVFERVL